MSVPSNDDALADPWQVVVRGRSGPRKCRPRLRVTGRAREERAGAEEREDGGAQPDGDGEMQPLGQPRHLTRGHLLSPRSKTRETHQVDKGSGRPGRTRDIEDEVRQRLRHHEHHPDEHPEEAQRRPGDARLVAIPGSLRAARSASGPLILGQFGMDRAGGKYSRHLPPNSEASLLELILSPQRWCDWRRRGKRPPRAHSLARVTAPRGRMYHAPRPPHPSTRASRRSYQGRAPEAAA